MSAARARLVFLCNRPFALEAALRWPDVEVTAVFTAEGATALQALCRRAGVPCFPWRKGAIAPIIGAAQEGKACAIVSNGYPWILPETIRMLPGVAVVNLHPSLLPAGRGPHPVNHATLAGLAVTGATCHHVDAGLDTGNILAQCRYEIPPEATAADLYVPLFRLEAEALRLALPGLLAGDPGIPQPVTGASLYRRTDADMQFNWTESATACHRRVRAFNIAKLGVTGTLVDGRRLRAFASRVVAAGGRACAPGMGFVQGAGLAIGTGQGLLHLDRFVWEG